VVGEPFCAIGRALVGKVVVRVDERYYRPTEVDQLLGDLSRARESLGWKPDYDLESLCQEMVSSDIPLMLKDAYLLKGAYTPVKNLE
jgi:GDPmannose 4,6-dehydratase